MGERGELVLEAAAALGNPERRELVARRPLACGQGHLSQKPFAGQVVHLEFDLRGVDGEKFCQPQRLHLGSNAFTAHPEHGLQDFGPPVQRIQRRSSIR